jgi:hypothetical protein
MFSLIHPNNQKIFEDIKGVVRSRKSKKDRQYNTQLNRTRLQTKPVKTTSKVKLDQHEHEHR